MRCALFFVATGSTATASDATLGALCGGGSRCIFAVLTDCDVVCAHLLPRLDLWCPCSIFIQSRVRGWLCWVRLHRWKKSQLKLSAWWRMMRAIWDKCMIMRTRVRAVFYHLRVTRCCSPCDAV
jgi:hypothetical protein